MHEAMIAQHPPSPKGIVRLHSTLILNRSLTSSSGLGGLARRATLFDRIRNETANNTLFVDGGNSLAYARDYSIFRGELERRFMNRFSYVGLAPFNLDFIWQTRTTSELDRFTNLTGIPIIASNLVRVDKTLTAHDAFIVRTLANGVKVGFVSSMDGTSEAKAGKSFSLHYSLGMREAFAGRAVGLAKAAGAHLIVHIDSGGNSDAAFHETLRKIGVHLNIAITKVLPPGADLATSFAIPGECDFG